MAVSPEQQPILEQVVLPWCKVQGYVCTYETVREADQVAMVAKGQGDYHAYWFTSSSMLELAGQAHGLRDVRGMLRTPLVFAAPREQMAVLGVRTGEEFTTGALIGKVLSGEVSLWIAHPTQSGAGILTLQWLLSYLVGDHTGADLTLKQVNSSAVGDQARKLFQKVGRVVPDPLSLVTECVRNAISRCGGVLAPESMVAQANKLSREQGRMTLQVVYLSGALAVNDAPLGLMPHRDGRDPSRANIFAALQAYLLTSPEATQRLVGMGYRPAASTAFQLAPQESSPFSVQAQQEWGTRPSLTRPMLQAADRSVVEAALTRYQTDLRRPANSFYCLDGGDVMGNSGRWSELEKAFISLTDPGMSSSLRLRTHPGDRTSVGVYTSALADGSPWSVEGDNFEALAELAVRVGSHIPAGSANLYACLRSAVDALGKESSTRRRLVIVVSGPVSAARGSDRQVLAEFARAGLLLVVANAAGDTADNDLRALAEEAGGAYVSGKNVSSVLLEATAYK